MAAVAGVLALFGSSFTPEPVDGGHPLEFGFDLSDYPVEQGEGSGWRKERGGWHYSAQHGVDMAPRRRMVGVWVTGFEETSFFLGDQTIPHPDDPRRYENELEVNSEHVQEMIGRQLDMPDYHAVLLEFDGRRTRYPIAIDCFGGRSYTFVADRLRSARYLGLMPNPDTSKWPRLTAPYQGFRLSGEGGVIGQMERDALAGCNRRVSGSQ